MSVNANDTNSGIKAQAISVEQNLDDVYSPLTTFEELCSYGTEAALSNCSKFNFQKVGNEFIPVCSVRKEPLPMSTRFSDIKIQTNGRRYKSKNCPKTLVCHDMKGGYLEDKYVFGSTDHRSYAFRHWQQTDIFCYFSHHFVTIPPLMWISAAHAHGVKCIGTIITEHLDGENLCQKLLESSDSVEHAVQKLCLILKHFKFDGYLVNIENKVEESKVPRLLDFLRLLTTRVKQIDPENTVLWYDSITHDGKLNWQNELNDNNQMFFEACDGIFLNYCWNEETLKMSVENSGDRQFDVFVGVDVFGRGCEGGGGLNTYIAVDKIASFKLSLAIFAPGWTYECHSYDKYWNVDDTLWNLCGKYFYFRTLKDTPSLCNGAFEDNCLSLERCKINDSSYFYRVLLSTDFNQGFGSTRFLSGKRSLNHGSWYDLSEQSYQAVLNCFRTGEVESVTASSAFFADDGFLGGGCLKMVTQDSSSTANINVFEAEPMCPVWIPLNVSISSIPNGKSKQCVIVIVAWKTAEPFDVNTGMPIRFTVEFMKPSLHAWKVVRLNNAAEQIAFEKPDETVTLRVKDFVPSQYTQIPEIQNLSLSISDTPYAETNIQDWKLSCFVLDVNHCVEWNLTAFKLGAQRSCLIGLASLGLLSY